jgi:glycosyltransferase involved in cell wall biosynthesis/predicted N-acetyltransferase YhbS
MPTRVLWLTKGLGPGGTERLLVELARACDGHRVTLTTAYVLPWKDHLAGDLEAAGVTTVCLSTWRRDLRWPLRLRQLVAHGGFDVVHTHSPLLAVAARLAARTVGRRARPALVTTEHNTWASYHWVTRWADRLTNVADAATYSVTAEVQAGLRGPAAAHAVVLVHGIDVARTAARPPGERAAIRRDLGLASDELVVVSVANLRPQKDHGTLLAAARILADRGVPFRLVVVGQGPLEREVAGRRDELALGGHVILAGFRPDAVAVMAAGDVFVLASAWEGLPVAVMEASVLGLPIVATRVGGVAEHLGSGAALLVPPRAPSALADALEAVLTDPRRRAELSAASASVAPRFDVHRAMSTLTARYEQLAGRGSAPPPVAVDACGRGPARSGDRAGSRRAAAVRPATPDDREQILALLRASLGWQDDDRWRELFAWKHERNPFGPSSGWVVEDEGRVVAVRLFMRWAFRRGGTTLRAVRAVDTATHPDHQQRGLFSALTRHAVEVCRSEGVAFVFNTPNGVSRPGYLKLGWRAVGRPPTAVRLAGARSTVAVARSRVPAEQWSIPLDCGADIASWLDRGGTWPGPPPASSADRTLRTASDERYARWRYGLAALHYRVVEDGREVIVVRLRRRGAGRELVVAEQLGDPGRADRLVVDTLRAVGATHAVRLGGQNLRQGFVPVPGGGPVLTWRGVCDHGPPPLPNWDLRLGDLELF